MGIKRNKETIINNNNINYYNLSYHKEISYYWSLNNGVSRCN